PPGWLELVAGTRWGRNAGPSQPAKFRRSRGFAFAKLSAEEGFVASGRGSRAQTLLMNPAFSANVTRPSRRPPRDPTADDRDRGRGGEQPADEAMRDVFGSEVGDDLPQTGRAGIRTYKRGEH